MNNSTPLKLLLPIVCLSTLASLSNADEPSGPAAPETEFDQIIDKAFTDKGYPSLVVGVVRGNALVYTKALGAADKKSGRAPDMDTLYRIGSISKVFTGTLLAGLREQGVVNLDDPIAKYLPEHLKLPADPRGESKIRLWHLATHTSGLPRQPINVQPAGGDAYNNYSEELLYAGLGKMRLENPVGATMQYSNLGAALLGHVLSRAAKKPYEKLLHELILIPLEMKSTTLQPTDEQRQRFAIGYGDDGTPVTEWNLGVLAPAGAIFSTVNDMAKFVSWQLRAGDADVSPLSGGALQVAHSVHAMSDDFSNGFGLGWIIRPPQDGAPKIVWHNGGTAGHRSCVLLAPGADVGVIVFTNCGTEVDSLARKLMLAALPAYGETPSETVDPELLRIAKALVPYFVTEPADDFTELFHPSFLKAIPADQIKPIFIQLATLHGPAQSVTVERGNSNFEGLAKFRFKNDAIVRVQLIIDAAEPARIVGAQVLPG